MSIPAALGQDKPGEDTILRGQNRFDANAGTVMIMTTRNLGAPFMRSALDLSNLLDSGERFEDMRVVPVVARGKVQNLWDVLYLRGIDMGFVQSDILEFMKDDPRLNSVKSRIRYITVMYPEEVHIVARKDIQSIQDLNGQTISINAKGTGSSVVGTILMDRLGIDATLIHEDTRRAIARMKTGEIAAHFNVLGKPTQVVRRIEPEGKLHLLPIPYSDEIPEVYLPATLSHEDYPNLIPEGQTIPTIAAGNLLVTFNWPENTYRGRKVKKFVDAFFDRFGELKQEGYHPKWNQVNLNASMPGWTRLDAAQDWLDRNAELTAASETQPPLSNDLQQQFSAFLTQSGVASGQKLDSHQIDALFAKFVEWRATQ